MFWSFYHIFKVSQPSYTFYLFKIELLGSFSCRRQSINSSVKFTFLKRHLSNRISREHVYIHILRNQTIWFNTSNIKILRNNPAMDFLYRRFILKRQLKYNSNCCLLTCWPSEVVILWYSTHLKLQHYVTQKNSSYYELNSCIYCGEKHKKSGVNLLLHASLLLTLFLCFSLECLLSLYWDARDFFHVSLRGSNRFYSNCSTCFRNCCIKTGKRISAKTKRVSLSSAVFLSIRCLRALRLAVGLAKRSASSLFCFRCLLEYIFVDLW